LKSSFLVFKFGVAWISNGFVNFSKSSNLKDVSDFERAIQLLTGKTSWPDELIESFCITWYDDDDFDMLIINLGSMFISH